MNDNLAGLRDNAEFFDSHTSQEFIARLAKMYMLQEPACLIVRGLEVSGDLRPRDLGIPVTGKEQQGERYSKEVAQLLAERLGSGDVMTDMGNVIREPDPGDSRQIRKEPTHTHPEVKINNMFCNISDGAISRVTFADDVWERASEEERALFETCGMMALREGTPLWYADFMRDHDILEKLEELSASNDAKMGRAAAAFEKAIRDNARDYYLKEGDMVFFAQLKTLRGAPSYPTPAGGVEKRWYQSMTYA